VDGTPITVQGTTLLEKLTWLQRNAKNGGNYIVEVVADESITPSVSLPSFYGEKGNIIITLKGIEVTRTITFSDPGGFSFSIGSGVTLILDSNIKLTGQDSVYIAGGGKLIMENGSIISGTSVRNDVYLNDGTFIMNGGILSDSGVEIRNGSFIMNGGIISGNSTLGIEVSNWDTNSNATFTMNGGTISNTSIRNYDGGIIIINDGNITDSSLYISGASTLTMNGGTISYSNIHVDWVRWDWVHGTFTMNSGIISNSIASLSGRFNMNGGSISEGNVSVNGVYVSTGDIFTLSGQASVSELILSGGDTINNASIIIASGWTGTINTLNLSGYDGLWADKTVVQADSGYILTIADMARISLKYFIAYNNNKQLINGNTDGKTNYNLTLENNAGVLKALP